MKQGLDESPNFKLTEIRRRSQKVLYFLPIFGNFEKKLEK